VDFSKYSGNYSDTVQKSIDFAGVEHSFFTELKAHSLLDLAERCPLPLRDLDVLDIGCGVGLTDQYLNKSFRSLHGIDVDPMSVAQASEQNKGCHYQHYDGNRLPYVEQFDLAFTICVMHHVPPSNWLAFLKEAHSVLKPSGMMAVYEHNPLNPLTRKVVRDCPMDDDAVLLRPAETTRLLTEAGFKRVETRYLGLFPFRNRLFRKLESRIPIGSQYVCFGFKE
jgi:SAM-dependent methyltransferase